MKKLQKFYLGLALLFSGYNADANVVIQGTRIIYPSNATAITVKMTNEGVSPSLVQSWIDDGNANDNPATAHVPFVITPPIIRVNPNNGQELRIMYTGQGLPTDRESIYWLNVLDIPSKASSDTGNQLALAVRSRLKLFYRPASLKQRNDDTYKDISFEHDGSKVKITNNSAYYISILSFSINGNKNKSAIMLAPFTSQIENSQVEYNSGQAVKYSVIDDFGSTRNFEMQLK